LQEPSEMKVSVVIPTYRRPAWVRRAAESALAQTVGDLEVIVVPAAEDPETEEALRRIEDERLRVAEFVRPLGASEARNVGVRAARGDWIAFLDDDDFWLPHKLERQLAAAAESSSPRPLVSCGLWARDERHERRWPSRVPDEGEPVGDYLFRRNGLWGGGGFVQTSTILAPRDLACEVPFSEGLRRCEDMDWTLRATRLEGVELTFASDADGCPDPLVVWHIDEHRRRESFASDWRNALAWLRTSRDLLTPEAYAAALLNWAGRDAAREGAGWAELLALYREARRLGRPAPLDSVVHFARSAAPYGAVHWLAGRAAGRRLGDGDSTRTP